MHTSKRTYSLCAETRQESMDWQEKIQSCLWTFMLATLLTCGLDVQNLEGQIWTVGQRKSSRLWAFLDEFPQTKIMSLQDPRAVLAQVHQKHWWSIFWSLQMFRNYKMWTILPTQRSQYKLSVMQFSENLHWDFTTWDSLRSNCW